MKKLLFIIAVIAIPLVFLIHVIVPEPTFSSIEQKILHASKTGDVREVPRLWKLLINKNTKNIDFHYNYINSHFNIPKKEKKGKYSYIYRNDSEIIKMYDLYALSVDSELIDISYYGKGLILVNQKYYRKAIEHFLMVKNPNLKYLNNSIGNCYRKLNKDSTAIIFLKKEITLKGNLSGSTNNLFEIYLKRKHYDSLKYLVHNENVYSSLYPSNISKYYLINHEYFKYYKVLINSISNNINLGGFIGAVLILMIWVFYVKSLDIYEPEPWGPIIITLFLGILFSFGTFIISDFVNTEWNFKLNGNILNDFAYSVIGIGMVEELVKIIPLIILLRFSNVINEPYDYILYASISALGFAFVENLIYFNEYSFQIISSRAMLTSVGHMFLSSTIAYGIILSKYKYNSFSLIIIVAFFGLASIGHGFYDFWLINENVNFLSILSILFFISSLSIWNSYINNALNNSNFFHHSKGIVHSQVRDYLFFSLSAVFLYEYILISFAYGPKVGLALLIDSLLSGIYLLFFISTTLGQLSIKKGVWSKISFWGDDAKKTFYGDLNKVLSKKVLLTKFSGKEVTLKFIPTKGTVMEKYTIKGDSNWYLFKFDTPVFIKGYLNDYIFIKPKSDNEVINTAYKILVGVYIIKNHVVISDNKFIEEDLIKVHYSRAIIAKS